MSRVHGQSSPPASDMEETTNQTIEDTESESVEQDLHKKDPNDIQDTIELPPVTTHERVHRHVTIK